MGIKEYASRSYAGYGCDKFARIEDCFTIVGRSLVEWIQKEPEVSAL